MKYVGAATHLHRLKVITWSFQKAKNQTKFLSKQCSSCLRLESGSGEVYFNHRDDEAVEIVVMLIFWFIIPFLSLNQTYFLRWSIKSFVCDSKFFQTR